MCEIGEEWRDNESGKAKGAREDLRVCTAPHSTVTVNTIATLSQLISGKVDWMKNSYPETTVCLPSVHQSFVRLTIALHGAKIFIQTRISIIDKTFI